MPMLVVGEKAPDFTLTDAQGNPHTLSDALKKGPVLLAFWKASCQTSRMIFPYLDRLRKSYPSDKWQLWGISQEPTNVVETFLERVGGADFPQLIDYPTYPVSQLYDPIGTPSLFYVKPDDSLGEASSGFSKAVLNTLSGNVAALLGEAPKEIAPSDDGKPPLRPG